MNLKRTIRIFWLEHGNPILLVLIIAGILIFSSQALNSYVRNKQESENEAVMSMVNTATNEIEIFSEQEEQQNRSLVQKFIQYNENQQLEQAYEMLAKECKEKSYPTVQAFQEQYYKLYFAQSASTEVEKIQEGLYKITFYKGDALETGNIKGSVLAVQYYRIYSDESGNKSILIESKEGE